MNHRSECFPNASNQERPEKRNSKTKSARSLLRTYRLIPLLYLSAANQQRMRHFSTIFLKLISSPPHNLGCSCSALMPSPFLPIPTSSLSTFPSPLPSFPVVQFTRGPI
ncbi:hypothetical protein ACTXT7_009076 [Hymenolepis weldensis]